MENNFFTECLDQENVGANVINVQLASSSAAEVVKKLTSPVQPGGEETRVEENDDGKLIE